MIQIVFTDNGKVHTVTFSGEEAPLWADKFSQYLSSKLIKSQFKVLSVI